MNQNFRKLFLLLVIILSFLLCQSQFLEIQPSANITNIKGDDTNPTWSADGKKVLFQSNRDGNWDIFQYDLASDSTIQLTYDQSNEQHPKWLDKQHAIAYTADYTGVEKIYRINLSSGERHFLFNREIYSTAPSLPSSEYLVYCLGFNPTLKTWGIYRYEFKYQSLKHILPVSEIVSIPVVNNDGEFIMFVTENPDNKVEQLTIINWYGEIEQVFSEYNFTDPSWHPDGLKIIFVSDKDEKAGEIYTMWKDGTHLERLTNDTLIVKNPVVSPDGKYLAVSVLKETGFDLFIISLEDY